MKKILVVFGTRPEAIKMVPLVQKFKEHADDFEVKVCVTAQHREMLDQVLDLFGIIPDFDLDIMKPRQDLYDVTANVLLGMKTILEGYGPDMVLVHGDTSTTFAASLAAFYQRVKVAHVEAGLRTGDIYSPWPEEANRQLTTQIAAYHFAPTQASKENLLKENVNEDDIDVTGNTVIDALFLALDKIKSSKKLESKIINSINALLPSNYQLPQEDKMILVTGHRRENHGQGFINICTALKEIAVRNPQAHIVFPVHLNPNVQKSINGLLSNIPNIHLIKPLRYEQFVYMMYTSHFIITDSGGVQEEAPSLGKPVLVMRDITERPEALDAGTVKLVGTDTQLIISEAQKLLNNEKIYSKMSKASNPYGDGHACEKIVDFIRKEKD